MTVLSTNFEISVLPGHIVCNKSCWVVICSHKSIVVLAVSGQFLESSACTTKSVTFVLGWTLLTLVGIHNNTAWRTQQHIESGEHSNTQNTDMLMYNWIPVIINQFTYITTHNIFKQTRQNETMYNHKQCEWELKTFPKTLLSQTHKHML